MNNDIIRLIPSKAMRESLMKNHLCEAERVSFAKLNSADKHTAHTIRKILARQKYSLPHNHRAGKTQSH